MNDVTVSPPAPRSDRKPAPRNCSIARTLEVVGEKWALLALREVFLGAGRFEDMVRNIGAPRDTLATRLRSLVDHGVLAKRRYSERPPRDEYVLTDAGRELQPVLLTLMNWGDKHLATADGPPRILAHRPDGDPVGHRLEPQLRCACCGEVVLPTNVRRMRAEPAEIASPAAP
jgi:DNA-binding HxlR family transcriptional regulator